MTPPAEITRRFIERINTHDLPGLAELMTDDHQLVDPGGLVVAGAPAVREAWAGYFRMVPDYWIEVEDMFARGAIAVVLGRAGGTYAPHGRLMPERRWAVPAAWRAEVRGGLVVRWQVYADNEPLRALMVAPEHGGPGAGAS
jgi:ketosteroid isomerase-like protein